MEEPRSRIPLINDEIIIDNTPDLPVWLRFFETALTIVLWGVYLYLVRVPVAAIASLAHATGWYGAERALERILPHALDWRVLPTFLNYLLVIAINSAALVLWARYNLHRYGGVRRRKESRSVAPAALAARYGVKEAQVVEWQASRRMVMRHDFEGGIHSVESSASQDERQQTAV